MSMSDAKCKKCRRAGEKLFLKGDKCFTPKCPFIERPYAPGILDSDRKHRTNRSEYGDQMREKQKLRNMYGLSEKQFSNYVGNLKAVAARTKTTEQVALYTQLEERLDNVVFRMGLASSRSLARQIVNHGHITVNAKKLDIPSYSVKVDDVISVREGSKSAKIFTNNQEKIAAFKAPKWLDFDGVAMSAKVLARPIESDLTVDVQKVLEFYSR